MPLTGTKILGKDKHVKGFGLCQSCEAYVQHESYNGKLYLHVLGIPLKSKGNLVRVIKQCPCCKHCMELPVEKVPQELHEMEVCTEDALAFLSNGLQRIDIDGTYVHCIRVLLDAIEPICCLGARFYVKDLIRQVKTHRLHFEYSLLFGEWKRFNGDIDEAEKYFKKAIEHNPNKMEPYQRLGLVYQAKELYAKAKNEYEKAAQISPKDLDLQLHLLKVYVALREHNKLAKACEACFRLSPALSEDTELQKAYLRACKKAGLTPMKT